MSRAAGLCIKCGGPKRGRAARTAAPIGQCESCRGDICLKHARWQGDYYLCYTCERKGKKSDVRVELPAEIGLPPELDPVVIEEEVTLCDDATSTWLGSLY